MVQPQQERLAQMSQAIVHAVAPERIILFGSHARGDATTDSDIDLLIIEAIPFGPQRSRRQEIKRIRQALSRFQIPKDILVYSRDEIDKWQHSPNHIIAHSLREGRVLYERS